MADLLFSPPLDPALVHAILDQHPGDPRTAIETLNLLLTELTGFGLSVRHLEDVIKKLQQPQRTHTVKPVRRKGSRQSTSSESSASVIAQPPTDPTLFLATCFPAFEGSSTEILNLFDGDVQASVDMMLKLEDIRSNAGMATGADVDIAGLEIISDRSDASSISSTASSHQQLTSTAVNTDAARPLTPEIIDEPLKNLSISETSSPKRKRRGPPPNRLQSLPSVPSRSINGANSSQHSSTSTNSFPSDGLLTPAQKNALQSLSSMFPAYTASELERVAKPHHFDVQKTADTILRNGIPSELSSKSSGPSTPWSSVASGSESARENDPVIVELRRLFPDAYHEDVYHAAVDGEWNTEKAASVLLDLMEKRKANSKYVVMGTTIVSGTNYSWSEPPRGAPVKSRIRSEGRKPQHDPQYCREMAAMVHEKRRDLFIKAANAFSKGNLTGKGAASYFAQEAQKLASEVQEWNRLAAQGIIEEHRKRVRDPNVIDVHHLTVAEALEYVLEELQQWDRRRRLDMAAGGQVGIAAATTPFVIITGTGRHREAGVGSKLYSAIARRLVVDGWKVRKDHNQDKLFIVGRTF